MSDLTATPSRPPTSAHRARVLSEAVVSAYLRDISPPRRRPAPAVALAPAVAAAPGGVGTVSAPRPSSAARRARARARARAAQRRSPLALGTAAAVQALRRP